jgi:hypothetical protein
LPRSLPTGSLLRSSACTAKRPMARISARLQQRDLAHQEGLAGRHLGRFGVAVARRPALQRVGDVDPLAGRLAGRRWPGQLQRAQHAVQQLAGGAHEGLALQVFLLARRFADDHPRRLRVADAEHRLRARAAQAAGLAVGHGGAQRRPVERGDVAGAVVVGQRCRGRRGCHHRSR